jgi:hypothetical protein
MMMSMEEDRRQLLAFILMASLKKNLFFKKNELIFDKNGNSLEKQGSQTSSKEQNW